MRQREEIINGTEETLSPFVNLFAREESFCRIASDIETYMRLPLAYDRDEIEFNQNIRYPVCRLGDAEIHFNHCTNFEQACEVWERRKGRIKK